MRCFGRHKPRITPSLKLIAMLVGLSVVFVADVPGPMLTSMSLDCRKVSNHQSRYDREFLLDFALLQSIHINVNAILQKVLLAVELETELV